MGAGTTPEHYLWTQQLANLIAIHSIRIADSTKTAKPFRRPLRVLIPQKSLQVGQKGFGRAFRDTEMPAVGWSIRVHIEPEITPLRVLAPGPVNRAVDTHISLDHDEVLCLNASQCFPSFLRVCVCIPA